MNRAILEALIPAFIALVASFVLLRIVIRLSGAKLDLGRLKTVHSCEHGGVQSLSFVLTLPLFIMIILFIIQVSQLMLGLMTIHYAAYAAARSAIVWAPAHTDPNGVYQEEFENVLLPPLRENTPITMSYNGDFDVSPSAGRNYASSCKLNRMFTAAVLGIAPVCPSREIVESVTYSQAAIVEEAVQGVYERLDPESYAANPRIGDRLHNKLAYAWWNTRLTLSFTDKDTYNGPTYNPRVIRIVDGTIVTDAAGEWIRDWNESETGSQDPLTLTVTHDFALLPGPGRFLARYIVRSDGAEDRTAARIDVQTDRPFLTPGYTVRMSASATMTSEGFKPLLTYLEDQE
ncbi:MAG: TadE/TadG family type IV pilus assembly protein [Planctomycetaceae bacterium]